MPQNLVKVTAAFILLGFTIVYPLSDLEVRRSSPKSCRISSKLLGFHYRGIGLSELLRELAQSLC
jgi:hypothetical protein